MSSAETKKEEALALAAFHEGCGAVMVDFQGRRRPAHYGAVEDEYRALREGCGLVDRGWLDCLAMSGEDRARFLNGLVTCDVIALEPGEGTYGFVTDVKGRILADLTVLAEEDSLRLVLPAGRGAAIAEHLLKYRIIDRVEVAPCPATVPLTVLGPRAQEVLAPAEDLPTEAWSHRLLSRFGVQALVVAEPALGVSACTLWSAAAEAERLAAALLEQGATAVGHQAYEILRVESGRPRYGQDFQSDHFPQETGRSDGVSYTKGCYLGQEVVARIHYRGGVNRQLRGLLFADESVPTLGAEVEAEGRGAGILTSAVVAPALGRTVGLAILHKRVEAGAQIAVAEGSAEVVALPFALG